MLFKKRTFTLALFSATSLFAALEWSVDESYNVGDTITFEGNNYVSLKAHSSYADGWVPTSALALWKAIPSSLEWIASAEYVIGDTVIYHGITYVAYRGHRSLEAYPPTLTMQHWRVLPSSIEWTAGTEYKSDDLTYFNGLKYRIIQPHISEADSTPDITPALWEVDTSNSEILPPDPCEEGKITIEGIDSDNDGVRDDLQRYISLNYNDNDQRNALRQFAIAQQSFLLSTDNKDMAMNSARERQLASDCIMVRFPDSWYDVKQTLKKYVFNTKPRLIALLEADAHLGGETFRLTPSDQKFNSCKCEEK